MGVRSRSQATAQRSSHPVQSIQSHPTLVPCLHWSLSLLPPFPTHPHRSLILPSPHPQDQSHQGRSHCSLISWKNRTLSAESGRTRGLMGWLCLDPTGTWALVLVQAQHQLCLVTESVHVSVPPKNSCHGLLYFY